MLRPVIYIAGPFRAKGGHPYSFWEQEQNVRRAEALALEVWRRGAAAICPHTNTRNYQGAAPDHVWLEGDIALLAKCDAVLMLETWRNSKGAEAEHAFALDRGIPVLYDLIQLDDWIEKWERLAAV